MTAAFSKCRLAVVRATTLIALFCLAAGAQSGRATTPLARSGANVVDVDAREYAFVLPASIPAGLTTFRLRNDGHEPHHVMLFRLDSGRTLKDVMPALTLDRALPTWMHAVGGPNTPAPGGGVSNGTVLLEPGPYVVFCMVPSADGQPHYAKGMVRALTVTPSSRARATLPRGDLTVTMRDYAFAFSRPPTRGRHRIAVTNAGAQPHELILSRLAPGKTSRDFVRWIETQDGPPPVQPLGGTTDMPPGGTMLVDVDLTPGTYSLLCRVRDAHDGKPHDAHGMLQDFVVK